MNPYILENLFKGFMLHSLLQNHLNEFLCKGHTKPHKGFFPFKTSPRIKLHPISASLASTARAPLASSATLEDPLARESPLRLLSSGLLNQKAGSKEKEMVAAPALLLLGLRLAAQAHRYHFDRKHPADLNRGFGRQEEPRRNGSHLVCLSESGRRRRPWRRREQLRSYTSQGLPPFPRPLPRPFSPPQATQPAQLPAENKVR